MWLCNILIYTILFRDTKYPDSQCPIWKDLSIQNSPLILQQSFGTRKSVVTTLVTTYPAIRNTYVFRCSGGPLKDWSDLTWDSGSRSRIGYKNRFRRLCNIFVTNKNVTSNLLVTGCKFTPTWESWSTRPRTSTGDGTAATCSSPPWAPCGQYSHFLTPMIWLTIKLLSINLDN